MRHLLAAITVLMMMWGGVASAAGNSLTCDITWPPSLGCFYERTIFVLGPFEQSIGVQFEVDLDNEEVLKFSPYTIIAMYEENYAVWLELRTPKLGPVIGETDFLRLGFSVRF